MDHISRALERAKAERGERVERAGVRDWVLPMPAPVEQASVQPSAQPLPTQQPPEEPPSVQPASAPQPLAQVPTPHPPSRQPLSMQAAAPSLQGPSVQSQAVPLPASVQPTPVQSPAVQPSLVQVPSVQPQSVQSLELPQPSVQPAPAQQPPTQTPSIQAPSRPLSSIPPLSVQAPLAQPLLVRAQDSGVAEPGSHRVTLNVNYLKERHVLCGRAYEDPGTADLYRLLRTRVTQLMRQQGWNTVGVTSPGPGAGKSLTAINLAISMARDSAHRVYLVDGDLRRPSVAETLGIPDSVALIDYLASNVAADDALLLSDVDNLVILPGRRDESGMAAPELLTSAKMGGLFRTVRGRDKSSLVVVDLAPVLVGDDVVAMAPLLDCLLLVVEEGKTTVDQLRQTATLIKGFNLLGTVLNKSFEKEKHFSRHYYYGAGVATHAEPRNT